jgi:hypothetical protein
MAARILQWNAQRSVDLAMAPLLRDPKIAEYTIIAIQEPWLNPYQNTTHYPTEAARLFKLAWPKTPADQRPRVCTYVRRNILESDITYSSRDVLTVCVRLREGGPRIYIHNVYNEPNNTATPRVLELKKAIEAIKYKGDKEHIVVGD